MDKIKKENIFADYEKEPFFLHLGDPHLNACLGSQGSERAYYRGYLRSAILLVEDILNNKRYADFDSVVLPILFNARHSLELNLKFLLNTFFEWGLEVSEYQINHDIGTLFQCVCDVRVGDKELESLIRKIGPYIQSLSKIDRNGEEFRYYKTRNDQVSLEMISIVNLDVIRISLTNLYELTDILQDCLRNLGLARLVNSHTNALSRKDLLTIARLLPDRSDWGHKIFGVLKKQVIEDYALSKRDFSKALKLMQINRAMRPLIALDCDFISLTEERIEEILENMQTLGMLNPHRAFDLNFDSEGKTRAFFEYIRAELSIEDRVDLMTIYYLGREQDFAEYYEADYKKNLDFAQLKSVDDVSFLFSTIFLECFVKGISILGKPTFAKKLESLFLKKEATT